MDDGEVLRGGRRDVFRLHNDARNPFGGRRKRGEKREGKTAYGIAKFGAVRSVPGIDGVEGFKLGDAGVFDHAQQIDVGVGQSPGAAGESDQREQRARRPDFRIRRACGFQRGERQDDVADRSGADEKSFVND